MPKIYTNRVDYFTLGEFAYINERLGTSLPIVEEEIATFDEMGYHEFHNKATFVVLLGRGMKKSDWGILYTTIKKQKPLLVWGHKDDYIIIQPKDDVYQITAQRPGSINNSVIKALRAVQNRIGDSNEIQAMKHIIADKGAKTPDQVEEYIKYYDSIIQRSNPSWVAKKDKIKGVERDIFNSTFIERIEQVYARFDIEQSILESKGAEDKFMTKLVYVTYFTRSKDISFIRPFKIKDDLDILDRDNYISIVKRITKVEIDPESISLYEDNYSLQHLNDIGGELL